MLFLLSPFSCNLWLIFKDYFSRNLRIGKRLWGCEICFHLVSKFSVNWLWSPGLSRNRALDPMLFGDRTLSRFKKFKLFNFILTKCVINYIIKGGITLRVHLTPERPRNLIFSQFECKWMRLGISWKKSIFLLSGSPTIMHYMGDVKCSNPGFPVWVSDWVHNKTWIFSISQQETRAFLALQTAKINIAMAKRLKRLFLTSPTTSVWVPSYFICQEGEGKRLPGRMLRLRREEGDFSLS